MARLSEDLKVPNPKRLRARDESTVPVAPAGERKRPAPRVTHIKPPDRPPDKKIEVVHVYQWHLIIKALWPYAVLLAVVAGAVNVPFVEIAKVMLGHR